MSVECVEQSLFLVYISTYTVIVIVTKLRECISQWTFTVHYLVCVFSIAIWVALLEPNEWLLSIIRSIKCLVGKPRFSWGAVASFALQLCYRTRRPLLSLSTFDEYGTTNSDKIRGLRWDGYETSDIEMPSMHLRYSVLHWVKSLIRIHQASILCSIRVQFLVYN